MKKHNALVFSQFVSLLSIVRDALDKKGIPYAYLDGSTRDRKAQVDKFMKDDKVKIFLISIKAGNTGMNLTKADYVYILDPWWNPAVEAQATDRAYRIGQKRNVMVHRFITQQTFEEKINELLKSKKELADLTVANGEKWIGNYDNDELRALVNLR